MLRNLICCMQILDIALSSCPVSSHSILEYNLVANTSLDDLIDITSVKVMFDENFSMFNAKYA